nr:hypothetical protein [Candidatus Sigynarchaeota archaeon]
MRAKSKCIIPIAMNTKPRRLDIQLIHWKKQIVVVMNVLINIVKKWGQYGTYE